MIPELGHYALVLALLLAIVQSTLPLVGAARRDAQWMAVAEPAAVGQLALVLLAFLALTYAYVVSDFTVLNVVQNSHSAKPLLYKISGVWGNHEGSMVLWVLILALFGAMVALFGHNLPDTLRARVLAVQGMIGVAFLLFILGTSNPFERVVPPPLDGQDLNPLLQDPGLAFPPAWRSPRRCCTSAMSGSRSRSASRWRPCWRGGSMPPGRAGSGRGRWPPGAG